jgi:NADPH:quinone reductase
MGNMRQIEITQFGPPDGLRIAEGRIPEPGDAEELIEVYAAGVNRADNGSAWAAMRRVQTYRRSSGWRSKAQWQNWARERRRGKWVTSSARLSRAAGMPTTRSLQRHSAFRFPKGSNTVEAASLPETFFTVWLNVFGLGMLKAGETLLVHGGSGGVRITAVQLASSMGSRVFVTVGTDEKGEACRSLGAAAAINYRTSDFEQQIRDLTLGRGVDLILDIVGGSYTLRNLRAMASTGRLVYIHAMQSSRAEIDLGLITERRLTITGSRLRPQSVERQGPDRAGTGADGVAADSVGESQAGDRRSVSAG